MQEQWTRWEPVPGLAHKYDIEEICHGNNGLAITLIDIKSSRQKVRMIFNGGLMSYKWTNETYMDHRVHSLFREYGSNFFCEWTLFKVTNSEYAKYISETSGTLSDISPFTHFAFWTNDLIFEVLYRYEPEVIFVNEV